MLQFVGEAASAHRRHVLVFFLGSRGDYIPTLLRKGHATTVDSEIRTDTVFVTSRPRFLRASRPPPCFLFHSAANPETLVAKWSHLMGAAWTPGSSDRGGPRQLTSDYVYDKQTFVVLSLGRFALD